MLLNAARSYFPDLLLDHLEAVTVFNNEETGESKTFGPILGTKIVDGFKELGSVVNAIYEPKDSYQAYSMNLAVRTIRDTQARSSKNRDYAVVEATQVPVLELVNRSP